MDQERFRDWFTRVDDLTPAQRQEVSAALSGRPQGEDALAAIELGVDDERRCPHCASAGAVSRGKARGLRRYRCKACGKTFGALTGTALSGLHYKERWLSFGEALAEGETIVESAERCGIAPSTAFRWRHRFLKAVRQAPDRLRGIVEADETFVLESRKGERKLDRKPRRRGGKARKRGLSREQVPVLVAADRTGETLSCTLPILNAKSVTEALEPVVARDALLVSDANRCYPPVAAALDRWIAPVGVGDEQGVTGKDRLQSLNHALGVEDRQGAVEGLAGAVGSDQDRHLLAREAAFASLAAAPARLAVQLPLPLPALEHEGLVGLDDPAKAVRRLTDRLQEAVAPAKRRTRRNPAALGRLDNRLSFGQGLAEGQPALLVVQAGQRCTGEGNRMSCRRPCTGSAADRAPCPARRRRRWRNADSAARRPRRARSPQAHPRPAAVPTAPPRPPGAVPTSDRPHA